MIVYVVVINDRHCDPQAYVWSTAALAISYAKKQAASLAHRPEDISEEEIDGWLWYATYGVEGDSVWVVERVLDEA